MLLHLLAFLRVQAMNAGCNAIASFFTGVAFLLCDFKFLHQLLNMMPRVGSGSFWATSRLQERKHELQCGVLFVTALIPEAY